jgi:hypothetical protein
MSGELLYYRLKAPRSDFQHKREANPMRKNWLRGLLMGVSMALLLSGGVALAQDGLYNTFDKDCLTCWPGTGEPTLDKYLIEWNAGGWNPRYELCLTIKIDGALFAGPDCSPPPKADAIVGTMWFPCEWNGELGVSLAGREVNANNGVVEDPLGTWVWRMWEKDSQGTVIDAATDSFLLAETCEEEFVPEPGSMILLASGLAGLAGYASLRWRSRP